MTRPSARVQIIPDKISHVLATQGAVQFIAGWGADQSSVRLNVAPYDDMVVLFISRRSRTSTNLLVTPRCQILAGSVQAGWQLKMVGRAVCTGAVNAHPRRLELQHWLPEGTPGTRLDAVEFIPERIEYAEGEGDSRKRFYGETPAADLPTPMKRWLDLSFTGIVIPWLLSAAVWVVWYGWWGLKLRGRWFVLLITIYCVMGLMAGARLVYRATALRRWQVGRALRRDSGILGLGWLPQRGAWLLGVVLMASATRRWPSTTWPVRRLTITLATQPTSSSTPSKACCWAAGCTRQLWGLASSCSGASSP